MRRFTKQNQGSGCSSASPSERVVSLIGDFSIASKVAVIGMLALTASFRCDASSNIISSNARKTILLGQGGRTVIGFASSAQVERNHHHPWCLRGNQLDVFASLGSRNDFLIRKSPLSRRFLFSRGGANLPQELSSSSLSMSTFSPPSTKTGSTGSAIENTEAGAKLTALRKAMAEQNLQAWIVPTDDPHLSEYVPDAYKRRAFLSGFGGSAGTAVVTSDGAYLWTDSRYYNEAGLQLDPNHWTLMKAGQPDVPTIPKFLAKSALKFCQDQQTKNNNVFLPFRVGIDPFVHAASFAKDLNDAFDAIPVDDVYINDATTSNDDSTDSSSLDEIPSAVGEIVPTDENLVDTIWATDRPPLPASPFRVHPLEFAGTSVQEKFKSIRSKMIENKATMSVFTTLDDVAYLFNLRAKGDIDTCPVGISYGIVTMDEAFLYCDDAKLQMDEVRAHLDDANVIVRPYDAIISDIQLHCIETTHFIPTASNDENDEQQQRVKTKVWMDTSRSNYALSRIIPDNMLFTTQNAVTPMKARKNEAELRGMRRAHTVDGAAMAKFMAWLEQTVVVDGRAVSEVEIDTKLTAYRAEQPGFIEVSFPTIAGVGSNGAIIHYRADDETDSGLKLLQYFDGTKPLLLDSGGQYEYGTTDVTRTWYLGTKEQREAPLEFRRHYTRVLKGNIGLDTSIFPDGTPGFVVDAYARRPLWSSLLDYGHGTGHGVGAALNVHEGPMSISPRYANKEGLAEGMILSNEPGYYEDGKFGIRIENLLEIVKIDPPKGDDGDDNTKSKKKKFLGFQKLTLIPIQKSLIVVDMMTTEELDWLDSYHAMVLEKVGALLAEDQSAMDWLCKACAPIDRFSSA